MSLRGIAITTFALGLLAACSPSSPEDVALPQLRPIATLEADIEAMMPTLLEKYNVPGASVAVLVDREIVIARGFGRLRAEAGSPPVTEHTVFQAASLSKPVVAFGVHQLPGERPGQFDLDRPLFTYRPPDEPFRHDDPRLGRITSRNVLSHTTGFPNWRPDDSSDNPKPLKIGFEPGTRFRYSGEGYMYLQRVVEQLTGETLDVFLRRTVLDPLDMEASSFLWQDRFEPNYATPHDRKGRPKEKSRPRIAKAAGTLHTTASDYARFLQAVLGAGPAGAEPWLERASDIDETLGWSLGWGFEKNVHGDVFWQWGDDWTFKALAAGSHERGVAVVVFTNGRRGLNVARPVVERVLGRDLQFPEFKMLSYR